jgi:hypothetical protein
MHIPPAQLANPWIWTHLSKGIRSGTGQADIDPWAHEQSVQGQEGQPWLRDAGDEVAYRHGAV